MKPKHLTTFCKATYQIAREDYIKKFGLIPILSSHPWRDTMRKPSEIHHEIRLNRGEILWEGVCCCVWMAKAKALSYEGLQ